MTSKFNTFFIASIVAASLASSPAYGQAMAPAADATQPAARWPAKDRYSPIALTVSPQRESKPALEFVLLPRPEEIHKGNAAVKYLNALQNLSQLKEPSSSFLEAARAAAPLADLDPKDPMVQEILNLYGNRTGGNLRWFYEGARLDRVDWETNYREQGLRIILPPLGGLRQLAKVLQLQIRLDIKRRDWAAAAENLRTGYALARHLGGGDTLIESLVGIAIASLMNATLEDWIAQPGAPNLYWALANLPTPFNDMRHPLRMEMASASFSFPEFREMQDGHFSPDGWTRLMTQIADASTSTDGGYGFLPRSHSDPAQQQFISTGFALVVYPQAKTFLLEHGMNRDAIDKMPVTEVLGRYFVRSFQEDADDAVKWAGLPIPQAIPGIEAWQKDFETRAASGQVNPLAKLMVPFFSKAFTLTCEIDRQLAMLRIVEAIRQYAAEKNQLPARLEDLTLPIPTDPTSGKPFHYTVQNGVAHLVTSSNEKKIAEYSVTLRK